jgi:hypothetical protein
MKRAILGTLATAAALMLGAGTVLGHSSSIPTQVVIRSASIGSTVNATGVLTSPNRKCLPGRKVKVFALFESGPPELMGTDFTSHNGAWTAGGTPSSTASGTRVKALRKSIGRRHHRRACKAASADLIVP